MPQIKMQKQIISVSASAGSGKTYNLAKRYIKLAFNENQIDNIIAMTFANKAALEMKYRIIEYLKRGALGLDCRNIFEGLDDIENKSAQILHKILNNYDDFNIGTIDSFKNYILKACAFNLNISPNFQIEKNYEQYLSFALDSFIRAADKNPAFNKTISDYLDQYFIFDKRSWFAKDDIFTEIKNVFDKASNVGKDMEINKEVYKEKFHKKCLELCGLIERFRKSAKELNLHKVFTNGINKNDGELERNFSKLSFSKYFLKEIPYNKDSKTSLEAEEIWVLIQEKIADLVEFYTFNYYAVYSKIYAGIIKEFDIQTQKDELVLLNEINKKTLALFKDDKIPIPEVYYRLSERYKHFLIDEFQDTNFVQWIGIKKFIEESVPGGGTLFYVGDIKQAIYNFRGGDPAIFSNIKNEFKNYAFEEIILRDNHRSGKAIVEFNNEVFSEENLSACLDDMQEKKDFEYGGIADVYKNSAQYADDKKTQGYVEVEIIDKEIKDAQDIIKDKFLRVIDDLKMRFEFKDIAVLCRKNSETRTAALWLMENNLPVESVQTLNIKSNSFVKQIISLIKFISSPIDKLSFASFILGEIFQKKCGIEFSEIEKFLFLFRDNAGSKVLYKDFRIRYPEIWDEYFEEFFIKAGFIPVYELLILILDKFELTQNFPDSKIFIMKLLELIKEFEKDDCGIKNFIEHFESLSETDESLFIKNAQGLGIKVMTVHKAKGLQFPVVVLPFASFSLPQTDNPFFEQSSGEIKLLRLPLSNAKNYSKKVRDIYDDVKTKSLIDELNTLYVSLTRAEAEMFVIVPPKIGNSDNFASILFSKLHRTFGEKTKYNTKKQNSNSLNFEDKFCGGYKDIRKIFARSGRSFSLSVDNMNAREKGIIIHFALSKIKTLKDKDKEMEIQVALRQTSLKFSDKDVALIEKDFRDIFSCKELENIFNYDQDIVFNEKEIVNFSGRTIRADKIINEKDCVLIYDFKSSNSYIKNNEKQIKDYIGALSQIYPAKSIRGFIVDLNKKNIVEVL
jgi:ATP-dependent exoDNAse (exonuclease V) beta subunit